MPRDGSNVYSAPSGTLAVSTTAISSTAYNAFVADLEAIANEARPVSVGGTGQTSITGIQASFKIAPFDAPASISGNWTFSGDIDFASATVSGLTLAVSDASYGDIVVTSSGTVWTVQDNAISTAKVSDNAITNAKLADNAITTSKIADDSVTLDKLASPQILIVKDEKASGVGGGGTVANVWTARGLNTIETDGIPGSSLSSNQIVLEAGQYEVRAVSKFYRTGRVQTRLYNATDNTPLALGTSCDARNLDTTDVSSHIDGFFEITDTKAIELQYQAVFAQSSSSALGRAASIGIEVYAIVSIRKLG